MNNTPFIYLSDQCEITDISDTLRSLSNISAGKDFLCELLGSKLTSELEEFCLTDSSAAPLIMTLPKSREHYRFAMAVKCSYGGAILYLLQNTDMQQSALPTSYFGASCAEDSLSSDFTGKLYIGSSCSDISSFFKACSKLTARLSSTDLSSGYSIKEEYVCGALRQGPILPLYCSSLLEIVTVLIRSISCVCSGDVQLSVASRGLSLELSVSAETDIIPPFAGNCPDIMAMSPYLHGSISELSQILLMAEKIGFHIFAVFSPTGRLSFNVSNVPSLLPPVEFKLPTDDEEEAAIIESIFDLLSSVKQQEDEQH